MNSIHGAKVVLEGRYSPWYHGCSIGILEWQSNTRIDCRTNLYLPNKRVSAIDSIKSNRNVHSTSLSNNWIS